MLEDNYKIIAIISILYSILSRELFLNVSVVLSIVFNFKNILFLKKMSKTFYIRFIIILIIQNYLIKRNNPFYQLFLFWLPFSNISKSLLMVKFISLSLIVEKNIFSKEIKDGTINISKFQINFKKLIKIIILLILTKLILFLFEEKFSYLLFKKNDSKYFIAANLFNNQDIFHDWSTQLLFLINYLGKENVFISIFENGDSTDRTAQLLNKFEEKLNELEIRNKIITSKFILKNEERITFLSKIRNKAIEPIYGINNWDIDSSKVIFFNDILYDYRDIIKLINTNNGNYDMVCGFDFYESFYDTWVSYGIDGSNFRHYYPYFFNELAQDLVIEGENLRIFSCWNGVTVFKAKPIITNKIKFRVSYKERQSECMLFCVDLWKEGYRKILLNPNVKVSYDYYYYYMNKYVYPLSKNLITYFYYYFKSDYRFEDFKNYNGEIILIDDLINFMLN